MEPRRLVLIGGSAGTGKTTVARGLSRRLDAGWLQVDTIWLAPKTSVALPRQPDWRYDPRTSALSGRTPVGRSKRQSRWPNDR